ncbi:MAG: GDP-mannose 4,6-dehydratase [Candidatus Parvarchaeota archaeon]|nr:GDP-mannose 4,6-dehydratase [Candidatus Parvarchaeum tengchongense]MCW1295722.1 GDP-mannose 4,6-dehydratase [Candidatus Parvarchaeum tengchongense]MCW1311845.1 GDP-mannose 4,6-dehydratase [Candidatus Parvarchaeum tengchongense]
MKKALITGITGQDGYFLSKLLLSKGYEVSGIIRRNSSMHQGTLEKLDPEERKQIKIYYGDITDNNFIVSTIEKIKPDEVYHLAAQSFVGYSFENPTFTYHNNIMGTLNVLNAVKEKSINTKLYFAATSELFGKVTTAPQNEETPFMPNSPYAISKLAGYWTAKSYREAYNLFFCNGILFNHESEVRGPEFVTRKISMKVAKISKGEKEPLVLGNLNSRKDWGYAKDFVEGMHLMLQQKKADDFVLATGEQHTVREFVEKAFKCINKEITWEGEGINEVGKEKDSDRILVKVSKEFFRPIEAENFLGDYSKANRVLGWKPKTKFEDLVKIMVENDINELKIK